MSRPRRRKPIDLNDFLRRAADIAERTLKEREEIRLSREEATRGEVIPWDDVREEFQEK